MFRSRPVANPGLFALLTKVATPSVLVLGLLLLAYFNFNGAYKSYQSSANQYNGYLNYSQGSLSYRFQQLSGSDRPVLRYAATNLLSYVEWSSTVSIDGQVQELWNTNHGYDQDDSHAQVINTIRGGTWQLIEIMELINDHTLTVTFDFALTERTLSAPSTFVFDIAHVINGGQWDRFRVGSGLFTALVSANTSTTAASLLYPASLGTLTLAVRGADAPPALILPQNVTSVATSVGQVVSATQGFFTRWTVSHPQPERLITLGSETLTFAPSSTSPGAPLAGAGVPLPDGQQ